MIKYTDKLSCLLVDDSPGIRQVLSNFIEISVKHLKPTILLEMHQANNGNEALEILQEMHLDGQAPDLIMLDWMMPHFNGLEFLTELKNTSALNYPHTRIAVLSAESYPQQMALMLNLGVMQYLIKPFAQEDIDELLNIILESRNAA